MAMTLGALAAFAENLPSVSVGTRWGTRTWLVGERGFAWERPLRKSDLARMGDRRVPTGDIIGVRVENLDAKDALLAMELLGFFTIEHFNGYPAILIALVDAEARHVRAAVADAHRAVASEPPKKPRARAQGRSPGRKRSAPTG